MTQSSRRGFLIGTACGLGSAYSALRWPAIRNAEAYAKQAAESTAAPAFEFFSSEQAAEVEGIAAQIIPSDGTAGARDARVLYFIDRALVSFDRDKQAAYTHGLKDLQAKVRAGFPPKHHFADLNSEEQIRLLTAIEHSEFFELVRLHTIMGFLARPEYGGNQDDAGWKLIGFGDEMVYEPPFGYYDAKQNEH